MVLVSLGVVVGTVGNPAYASSASNAAKATQAFTSDVGVQDICNYTTERPTIRRGSSGPAVKQAQCYLYWSVWGAHIEPIAIDGQFGPRTEYWVRVFQSCAGITVDGIVGSQTWSHLTYWANSPYYVC